MNEARALLQRCRELGVTLTPLPEGKLKLHPPNVIPADLRDALRRHKQELLTLLRADPPPSWPCPHCGNPAEVEAVAPSREGIYRLTFLYCQQCSVWAVTPSDLQEPPVWVSSKEQ
jgi:hypothetical protein